MFLGRDPGFHPADLVLIFAYSLLSFRRSARRLSAPSRRSSCNLSRNAIAAGWTRLRHLTPCVQWKELRRLHELTRRLETAPRKYRIRPSDSSAPLLDTRVLGNKPALWI